MKDKRKNCKTAVNKNKHEDAVKKSNSKGAKPSVNMAAENSEQLEAYISKEMATDARINILNYLESAAPLMNDLSGLFDEMNMNDPTKV